MGPLPLPLAVLLSGAAVLVLAGVVGAIATSRARRLEACEECGASERELRAAGCWCEPR